ncbi:MAG: DUF975 family protein [Oscillospiraceae bacterium]|nr:DUF975 family protein [Oscillospiraceae bacterium]
MWTCSEIRQAARSRIKLSLWAVILVTLVYTAIISVLPMINATITTMMQLPVLTGSGNIEEMLPLLSITSMIAPLINLAMIVLMFLVFNPMYVGYIRYLGSIEKESSDIGNDVKSLFWAFRDERYGRVLSGTAWKQLWMMIWGWVVSAIVFIPASILMVFLFIELFSGFTGRRNYNDFIDIFTRETGNRVLFWVVVLFGYFLIAGIGVTIFLLNRFYAYLFTEFVLTERTDMPYKAALDLSKQMTRGLKMKLFVLDLSFIGWYILSALTLNILMLWLLPYRISAYQEVYDRRKQELGIIMNPPVPQMGQPEQYPQPAQPYGNGAQG